MPYIPQKRRDELDFLIYKMGDNLNFDGDLNYLVFTLCKRYIKPSYNNYKNYLSEIQESIHEIRRRILVPYENQKIIENGDI